jgi:hypothetical protein
MATTITLADVSPNPVVEGQSMTFTATVVGEDGGTPTGYVEYNDGFSNLGMVPLDGGTASWSLTPWPGETLHAIYLGDGDFAGSTSPTVNVLIAPTITVADAGGTYNGSPFQAASMVTDAYGNTGPSLEDVKPSFIYYVGSDTSGTVLDDAPTDVGTYTVVADFPGSTDYGPAQSDPVTFSIVGLTQTDVGSSTNPSVYGQPVTLNASVDFVGNGSPSGSVDFVDTTTSTDLGTVAITPNGSWGWNGYSYTYGSGSASLTTTALAGGTHAIRAYYLDDPNFAASFSTPLEQAVDLATTITLASSSPNPSMAYQSVTFTASVDGGGNGPPSGSVDFVDTTTGTDLGAATLASGYAWWNGSSYVYSPSTASLTTAALGAGTQCPSGKRV